MKAVLSNRIYLNRTDELSETLKKHLHYVIPPKGPLAVEEHIFDVISINDNIISIPIGAQSLIPKDFEIVEKRILVPAKFREPSFTLYKDQQDIYDDITDSCIINATPSWGKTYTAIAIAHKLGQKTLVVVHTVDLRIQWEEEIRKVLKIEPGIIGSGKYETDSGIVVANIQTLNKYALKLKESFGTVIVDECHHVPANTFKNILDTSKARYKIGLSGTLKRKDGKHILIKDYIHPKTYTPIDSNRMTPTVLAVESDIPLRAGIHTPWATSINELVNREEYFLLIHNLARAYAELGHKVLVVADRVDFLQRLQESLPESSVVITSKTKNRQELLQEVKGEKSILFGSISIFKEGINEPHLSCLILATAIGNNNSMLRQLIGRVVRVHKDKLPPVVVDIILRGNTAKNQFRSRLGEYTQLGYKIKYIHD